LPLFRRPVRTLESPEAYALWAATYPPYAHNPLMVAEQVAMEAFLVPLSAVSALDVGTGSGRYLPLLQRTRATRVVGVDRSLAMLEHNKFSSAVLCADAVHLPFGDASFDLVVASLLIGHLRDLRGWLWETARVLGRGGHLLYSDVHPEGARRGWKRTFRTADGRWFAVRHYIHSVQEHREALREAGLRVAGIAEPRLGDQRGPAIEAFRRRWGDVPVALVIHAEKDRLAHATVG
jgi:malonyl-CoA O-methyltransferase